MSENTPPRLYRVAFGIGPPCSERLLDEVLMTTRQASDMRDLLKALGARDIEIVELTKDQPLTHAEAMDWIRRDV